RYQTEIQELQAEMNECKAKATDLEGQLEEKDIELKHYLENCLDKEELETQNSEIKAERDRLAIELLNNQNFVEVLRAEVKKTKISLEESQASLSKKDQEFEEYRQ